MIDCSDSILEFEPNSNQRLSMWICSLAEEGIAVGGKTAEIQINEDFCKGCTLCINACPQHLLHTSKRVAKTSYHPAEFVDPEGKCTGCALCALVCPDTAIRIYRKKRIGGKNCD